MDEFVHARSLVSVETIVICLKIDRTKESWFHPSTPPVFHNLKTGLVIALRSAGVLSLLPGKRDKDETKQIAEEILAYLKENPAAEDTLAGIVEWWLLEQKIRETTSAVQKALAELVRDGLVLERKGKDSQVRYCINPDKPPKSSDKP